VLDWRPWRAWTAAGAEAVSRNVGFLLKFSTQHSAFSIFSGPRQPASLRQHRDAQMGSPPLYVRCENTILYVDPVYCSLISIVELILKGTCTVCVFPDGHATSMPLIESDAPRPK
jgi:hypothetical protein